jgi:hypothetical protein
MADDNSAPPGKRRDSRSDVLLAYYSAARAEILARIGSRENLTALYLTAVAVLTGLAFGGPDDAQRVDVLYAIPVFGFAIAANHRYQTGVLRALSRYLITEYQASLEAAMSDPPVQWDGSGSHRLMNTLARQRQLSTGLVILAPQILASIVPVIVNWSLVRLIATAVGLTLATLSIFALWLSGPTSLPMLPNRPDGSV